VPRRGERRFFDGDHAALLLLCSTALIPPL